MARKSWDYEACYEEAKKYTTRAEFKKGCVSAYDKSRKMNWIKDYTWIAAPSNKPHTYEEVKAVVEQCENLTEFYTKHVGMYDAALRNGWMEEFENLKRRNSYSLEYVIETCNKYDSLTDFMKDVPGGLYHAYLRFYDKGMIKEGDVKWNSHTRKSWDYESCYEEAIKYKSSWHFKLGCESAYNRARKEGWLSEWFEDQRYKYTYDMCKELALECESKAEFQRMYRGAYQCAVRNNWIDDFKFEKGLWMWNPQDLIEACRKYETKKDLREQNPNLYSSYTKYRRLGEISDNDFNWKPSLRKDGDKDDPIHYVYVYDFGNKVAYVGRTIDPDNRDKTHRRIHHSHGKDYQPPVLKYSMESGIPIPEMTILESELTMQESRKMEAVWHDEYVDRGYAMLNAGSVGEFSGSVGSFKHIWTKDAVINYCKQFDSLAELSKVNSGVIKRIREYGLMDELFPNRQKHTVTNYDEFKKIASSCSNKKEFREKYKNVYYTTLRRGWMEDFFPENPS